MLLATSLEILFLLQLIITNNDSSKGSFEITLIWVPSVILYLSKYCKKLADESFTPTHMQLVPGFTIESKTLFVFGISPSEFGIGSP